MTDDGDQGASGEHVGGVSEETAKLLGALGEWAREQAGDRPEGGRAATGLGSVAQSLNDHIATGGAECTWCPVCQVIGAVRRASPEVRDHLASSASSLLQAAASLLETRAPSERSGPVERIRVTDEQGEED